MQKKSTSQSAFVNLRIVGGFRIFLLGVFLALVGVATPSASSHRFVATTHSGGNRGRHFYSDAYSHSYAHWDAECDT